MDSLNTGNKPVSFVQEMWANKFLLLAVVLGVSAAAYLFIGLFVLLGH